MRTITITTPVAAAITAVIIGHKDHVTAEALNTTISGVRKLRRHAITAAGASTTEHAIYVLVHAGVVDPRPLLAPAKYRPDDTSIRALRLIAAGASRTDTATALDTTTDALTKRLTRAAAALGATTTAGAIAAIAVEDRTAELRGDHHTTTPHHAWWKDRAACSTGVDPDLFFAPAGSSEGWVTAKRICGGCPVTDECLADAADDHHSIRAGKTPTERGYPPRVDTSKWNQRKEPPCAA